MSKIKVTFVETNCKKNGPIKQTLNIIRNMDKEAFEPSLVTVWPEDARGAGGFVQCKWKNSFWRDDFFPLERIDAF